MTTQSIAIIPIRSILKSSPDTVSGNSSRSNSSEASFSFDFSSFASVGSTLTSERKVNFKRSVEVKMEGSRVLHLWTDFSDRVMKQKEICTGCVSRRSPTDILALRSVGVIENQKKDTDSLQALRVGVEKACHSLFFTTYAEKRKISQWEVRDHFESMITVQYDIVKKSEGFFYEASKELIRLLSSPQESDEKDAVNYEKEFNTIPGKLKEYIQKCNEELEEGSGAAEELFTLEEFLQIIDLSTSYDLKRVFESTQLRESKEFSAALAEVKEGAWESGDIRSFTFHHLLSRDLEVIMTILDRVLEEPSNRALFLKKYIENTAR